VSLARICAVGVVGLAAGCGDPCDVPGTLCTFIGDGTNGFNGDGLPRAETWLYFPSALTWSPAGRLVVDDFNNMRIREVADDGTLRTLAGDGRHAFAEPGVDARANALENPIDVAYDASGALLIAELHGGRVLRVGPSGAIEVVAGTTNIGFFGNNGPADEAWFSQLSGIAVAADGSVVISDTDNHALRIVGTDGIVRQLSGDGSPGFLDGAAPRYSRPQRVRVDADAGVAWVADTFNHAIRRVDLLTGEATTVVGTGEPGDGGDGGPGVEAQLDQPYSAVPDGLGGLLIADAGNHRVRHLDASGTLRTLAGTGVAGFVLDAAPAEEAALNFPADVLPGPDGDVYIADLKNGAVRRVAGALDVGR
jgi:sugar lactone lactonase YvrE